MNNTNKNVEMNKANGLPNSVRYPAHELSICLEHAKKIFDLSGKHALFPSDIIADLGLSEKSGHAKRLLASMKYYSILIPSSSSDKFQISEEAMDFANDTNINQSLILKFLAAVPINNKLFSTYDINSLPSGNAIKGFLKKDCGYVERQADEYYNIFQKNLEFYKKFPEGERKEIKEDDKEVHMKSVDNFTNFESQSNKSNFLTLNLPINSEKSFLIRFPSNLSDEEKKIMIKSLSMNLQLYLSINMKLDFVE